MSGAERVLVIKLSALGDLILALPALARIRASHPDAHITLLTTPPFEALAKACPWLDAVETDGRPVGFQGFVALVRRIRRARYDRVYDLQANDRTNLLFQSLRPFPPAWSGTAFGCALPHRDPHRMSLHTLERQAGQLRDAGIWSDAPTTPGSAPGPDVSWMMADGAKPPPRARPLALLVPGASARRPRKLWPAELYGELALELGGLGYEVRLLGSEAEAGLAARARALAPAALDMTGQTDLFEVARLGAQAALAVGNDTGPLHLTAAAGAPTLALFSSDSDPALCAPRGRVQTLREDDLGDLDLATVLRAALAISDIAQTRTS